MEINESFLGTGWSFPPRFNKTLAAVETSSDEQDIRESLAVLLSTRLGERIMVPGYGCSLQEMLFAPIDLTLITRIREMIRNAILIYEPRIRVLDISVAQDGTIDGRVDITLEFEVVTTNSRLNMVYPFYRIEGNDISYTKTGEI